MLTSPASADAARTEITRLEAERLASGTGTVLAPILGTPDPAAAFLEAPIALQRTMIDTLMTVTLKRAKQGKKGALILSRLKSCGSEVAPRC